MKKGRYQIRIEGGALLEVDAKEFWVFGYGPLIVHRDRYYPTMWTCSEPRSGANIYPKAPTQKEAIAKGTEWMLSLTREEFDARLEAQFREDRKRGLPTTRYEEEEFHDESSVEA